MKVGDIVKSFDFNGVDNCYIIGEVTSIEDGMFFANVIKEVFDGEVVKDRSDTFRAPLQGNSFLDKPETPRIVVIG